MAKRLGDMLIAQGLITQEQLGEALRAQSQVGGRLGTSLVEHGFVTERQLAQTLSEQLHVPFVEANKIENVPREVINKIGAEVAKDYRTVPFALEKNTLHICMADPANLAQVDELRFKLNHPVKVYVITELALDYALERYYGIPRPGRLRTVALSDDRAEPQLVQLSDTGGETSQGVHMSRAEFLSPQGQNAPAVGIELNASEANVRDLSRHWVEVQTTNDVLRHLVAFMNGLFSDGILLDVDKGMVRGLDGTAMMDRSLISKVTVPIEEGSLLQEMLNGRSVVFRKAVDDAAVVSLCKALQLQPVNVTLIPVMEKNVTRYIVFGQGRTDKEIQQWFSMIQRTLRQASCALRIVALKREILAIAEEK